MSSGGCCSDKEEIVEPVIKVGVLVCHGGYGAMAMWSRLEMARMGEEEARRVQDYERRTANIAGQALPRPITQQYEYEDPGNLIYKHLAKHRDEIIRRHGELVSQGKIANVEIECRLGTLVHGKERVGAFEAGKEGAVVPGARFLAGVAGVHHRQFKEAAKREYEKQQKMGRRLKPEKKTLSDVWTPEDGSGRRGGRRYLRDAHPLTPEELARGMKSTSDRAVKQEIKHKDICPDLDIHLPSHKYDLRVSISIEEVVPGNVDIDFSSQTFDRQRDRYSVPCVLPPLYSELPLPVLDASEVLSRNPSGSLETTFEFELEANKEITAEFIGPAGNRAHSMKLGQSLWYGICSFIPQECNSSSLVRYAPWNGDDRTSRDVQGVKAWVLEQCGNSRSDRFPGAMPVSLDRWKFKETLLKYIKPKGYVVGEKTDGVRHFLVVASEKAFLVDREFSLFYCKGLAELSAGNSLPNGHGLPVGTILDGEIVRHRGLEDPRDIFLAFDIISRGTQRTHQLSFKDRRRHLQELVHQFNMSHPHNLELPLPLLQKKFWDMDRIDELNKYIDHDGIECVYKHTCPTTNTVYNHKCDGFIFVHNDPYVFGTDTFMMKWKPVEDLSIDFLVLFEKGSPKFYYIDDDDLLVDVSVLLHFEQGSQLSDHDLARVLADLNRYGQEQQTADGQHYAICEFAFDSETCAWHYMRPRTDKKRPNFRNTALPGLLDIGLNISKEELMYRLLCAEREDKAGDKWRKEMQASREHIFSRKRNEPHPASAPPRQQQRVPGPGIGPDLSAAGSKK